MSCDLERIYSKLATQLPESSKHEGPFALDESVIPAAPPEIWTDRLQVYAGYYERLPGCRGDGLDIVAARPTIRQLGLLALALLFHEQCDRTIIHLTQSKSRMKHIVLEYRHLLKSQCSGFRVRPWVLGYVPDETAHTFLTDLVGIEAPLLRLTNISNSQRDEREWQSRDTLWGIGGTFATAEIAEFLLNAGRNNATLDHFTIPANHTFFAAEVNLWLPEAWEKLQRKLAEFNRQQSK
jgi:hypothetical protein